MKKLLLLTIIATTTLCASKVLAQSTQFGIRAGLNVSSLSGDDSDGLDSKTGFHLGVIYNNVYTDKIALETGFSYSAKGASASDNNFSDIKLGYLDYHVFFKYYFTPEVDIHLGPQFGLLASAKDGDDNDLSDTFDFFDFGLRFGAGYTLDMGLGFAVHYYAGLTNIGAEIETFENGQDITRELKVKNNNLSFSVNYFF